MKKNVIAILMCAFIVASNISEIPVLAADYSTTHESDESMSEEGDSNTGQRPTSEEESVNEDESVSEGDSSEEGESPSQEEEPVSETNVEEKNESEAKSETDSEASEEKETVSEKDTEEIKEDSVETGEQDKKSGETKENQAHDTDNISDQQTLSESEQQDIVYDEDKVEEETVSNSLYESVENGSLIATGNCGNNDTNLIWTIYEDGTLEISGTGKTKDYYRSSPWSAYKDQITSIIICDGVTGVGNYAFYELTNCTEIHFTASLKEFGNWAFSYTGINKIY